MSKKISIAVVLVAVLIAAASLWRIKSYKDQIVVSPIASLNHESGNQQTPLPTTDPNLPKTLLLSVPFTAQAPTANWDELHNEACEEASSLMANAYFSGNHDATLPPAVVEAEISKLVQWEQQTYGYSLDTTTAETAKMIEQVYGLKTKLIENFTLNDVKSELAQNHLILISANGRLLYNPNYKTPGPIHHMLVIKGYTSMSIVTNDPGTRNGRNYSYDFTTIYNAAGDWDHSKNTIDTNRKFALVVWKE